MSKQTTQTSDITIIWVQQFFDMDSLTEMRLKLYSADLDKGTWWEFPGVWP
jgi:hypothetical protein